MSFDPFNNQDNPDGFPADKRDASAPGQRPQQSEPSTPQSDTNSPAEVALSRTRSRLVGPGIAMLVCAIINVLGAVLAVVFGAVYSSIPPDKVEEMMQQQQPQQLAQMKQAGWTVQDFLNVYTYGGYGGGAIIAVLSLITLIGAIGMLRTRGYGMAIFASVLVAIPCLSPAACVCFGGTGIGIWSLVVLLSPEVAAAFRGTEPPDAKIVSTR
jgi:hypothetical protein